MSDEEKRKKEEIENQKKEEPVEKKKEKEPEKPKEEKKEVKEESKETKPTKKSEGLVYLAVVIAAMIVVSGALVYWAFTHHKTIVINKTIKPHVTKKVKPTKPTNKNTNTNTNSSSSNNKVAPTSNNINIKAEVLVYYTKKYNLSKSQLDNIISTLNGKVKQILSEMGYNFGFNVTSVKYVELSNDSSVPMVPQILLKIDNSTMANTLEQLDLLMKYNDSYYMFRGFFEKYLYTMANVSYLPLVNTTMIIVSGSIVKPDKTTINEIRNIINKESYINVSNVTIAGMDNYTKYTNVSLFLFPAVLIKSNVNLSNYELFLGQMGSYKLNELTNGVYELPIMLTQAIFRVLEITKEPNITGLPVLGSSNAKVTIIEFADLHCPYCAMFAKDIENITSTYIKNGTVNYVFVIFPVHPSAMPLHKMLMCYWQLSHNASDYYKIIQWNYNTFISSREPVSSGQFENEVKKYYNIMSVENCISENNATLNQTLRNNLKEGMEYGIFGTPGIIIWNNEAHKGLVIVGYINNQTLKTYIQKVLSMS